MKTIMIYHGTNALDIQNVTDFPKAKPSINGVGFFCTLDVEVAQKYGAVVAVWEVEETFIDKFGILTRPIDQRYTEDMDLYPECAAGGMELVLTQQEADLMAVYCESSGSF